MKGSIRERDSSNAINVHPDFVKRLLSRPMSEFTLERNRINALNAGVYQNRLLARKVYDAAILVMVLGQEGGLVPSKGFPKPPFS